MLSSAGAWMSVPESIKRALAIGPAVGSTYLDAEHIVILMQENRSFDHAYGTLRGVRGFDDPRAHRLPNLNPVWLQTNKDGDTFAPFRLNIKETNVTWMGSLPHSWGDQVDARNDGHYDQWLNAKPCYYKGYEKMPMTLGHYTRQDIPFYYAFADAFTVCDQHFCSSLTGTTPNRLYLWSGTIRPEQNAASKPHVYNEKADFGTEVSWTTFPERLEKAGVSWKVYQNEVTIDTGFEGEEESWLSNFGDNPLEYFLQYGVRFCERHQEALRALAIKIQVKVKQLEGDPPSKKLADLKEKLKQIEAELNQWSKENFDQLPDFNKSIHAKAFSTSEDDPDFRKLSTLTYNDGKTKRSVQVPEGDVFYQFRKDVETGKLPTVSWIVGPENFSDHPASAWYGAWYVSEALDILTKNPEVWKKTIFILTYDENDGYFDHVPPFVSPNPDKPESGKVSSGIDAAVEYVTKEQDLAFRPTYSPRESSLGLGYRVPLVVASPWSRGGNVCSEVFDHTSSLQFIEHFLAEKRGQKVWESNISVWRRTVCGDLTSIFQPYNGGETKTPPFPSRDAFVEEIHNAKFKSPPAKPTPLSVEEIETARKNAASLPAFPRQEPGTRPSCPLPYELYADGALSTSKQGLEIRFRAGDRVFGRHALGSPFNVYAYLGTGKMLSRSYAVSAGDLLQDTWEIADFENGLYHVRVDGPNGFMREFVGDVTGPDLDIQVTYASGGSKTLSGQVEIRITNRGETAQTIQVEDLSYGNQAVARKISGKGNATILVDTKGSKGWYNFAIKAEGFPAFSRTAAGRVETGRWSITDPEIGRAL
jgi:phospholipase C